MDIQSLRALIEIAECGSFSRAADALFLSQPAVSKRIAALEAEAGTPLFDRIGRQISLTDAGRALLPYARRVLQDIEDGRRALSNLSGRVAGRLSFGTSHHIGLHRLPHALRAYTQKFPEVDLDIQFMDSEIACEAVIGGKLELGIVTLPQPVPPELMALRVWPDPLCVVASPGHPLSRKKRLKLEQLAEYPAVLPDEKTYTHRIVKSELERHGLSPHIRLATNYLETLKMLAGIGLGWSVLPHSMLDASLRPLNIPQLRMHRELGAVWHPRRNLSGAAQALLEQLKAESKS